MVETSPLLVDGTLYFGTWDHKLIALDVRDATHPRVKWTFDADSEIDSSPAYADGRVFFGTNSGHVYALAARDGHELWQATSDSSPIYGRQYFYAGPTLAFDRVYIGNTDGTLYVFDQSTGRLSWKRHAGTYIYTAAAIWRREVIIGTYDGHLIAYDALTGAERWSRTAPSAISGAPTVLDGVVYFSTCSDCAVGASRYVKVGHHGTYALDASTGRLLWEFPDGQYSPVVADQKRIYLAGWQTLYGLASTAQ